MRGTQEHRCVRLLLPRAGERVGKERAVARGALAHRDSGGQRERGGEQLNSTRQPHAASASSASRQAAAQRCANRGSPVEYFRSIKHPSSTRLCRRTC